MVNEHSGNLDQNLDHENPQLNNGENGQQVVHQNAAENVALNGQDNGQQSGQAVQSDTDQTNRAVNRLQIRVPPFWKQNPRLWFRQIEAQFANSEITRDLTKYNTVIGVVESDILTYVSDIVLDPPTRNRYVTIKNRLIKEFEDTEQKKLKNLFSELAIGEMKPSTLLRRMKELSCGKVGEELLKTLWLQRLPVNIQTMLVTSNETLSQLSATADIMYDIAETNTVQAIGDTQVNQIDNLVNVVDRLDGKIESLKKDFHASRNSTQRSSRNYRNSPVRASAVTDEDLCFYHKAFGKKARKCRTPCSFTSSKSEN